MNDNTREVLRVADQELARAERLITIAIAARRLQRCAATVRSWVKTGKLAGVRYPSGQYMVSAAAVENIVSKPLQAPLKPLYFPHRLPRAFWLRTPNVLCARSRHPPSPRHLAGARLSAVRRGCFSSPLRSESECAEDRLARVGTRMTTAYFNAIANYARSLISHLGLVDADGRELSGPLYQRVAVTWTVASDGAIMLSRDLLFMVPPNSIVGGWHGYSAASGGTDYGGESLPRESFNGPGEYLLKADGTGIVHRAT